MSKNGEGEDLPLSDKDDIGNMINQATPTFSWEDPNDPRVIKRNRRRDFNERTQQNSRRKNLSARTSTSSYSKARLEVEKQQQASAAFDLPSQPIVKTIGGGTAMIFAMARKMWEQEKADIDSDNADAELVVDGGKPKQQQRAGSRGVFPRWRPTPTQTSGISNFNPNFRTEAPIMNSQGFASTIWRNVRKRNKPSLWRYALRTYDRMALTSSPAKQGTTPSTTNEDPSKTSFTTTRLPSSSAAIAEKVKSLKKTQRTNVHYHGALLAAAKLGLWEKAFEIFSEVELGHQYQQQRTGGAVSTTGSIMNGSKFLDPLKSSSVHVTDYMVVSLVNACVRASRNMRSSTLRASSSNDAAAGFSLQDRRKPLDEACKMLHKVKYEYGINIETRHYNPLAAAYLHLRLRKEAEALIHDLRDRQTGPEPEDGVEPFNINDIGTKDKGAYTLLVSGAVQEEDWVSAVDALRNMTEAGLYPNQRHLNAWNEVSERKTKHRTTRSWKKKRDELWIERGLQR